MSPKEVWGLGLGEIGLRVPQIPQILHHSLCAAVTNTINRADLTAIATAPKHDYTHIAKGGVCVVSKLDNLGSQTATLHKAKSRCKEKTHAAALIPTHVHCTTGHDRPSAPLHILPCLLQSGLSADGAYWPRGSCTCSFACMTLLLGRCRSSSTRPCPSHAPSTHLAFAPGYAPPVTALQVHPCRLQCGLCAGGVHVPVGYRGHEPVGQRQAH